MAEVIDHGKFTTSQKRPNHKGNHQAGQKKVEPSFLRREEPLPSTRPTPHRTLGGLYPWKGDFSGCLQIDHVPGTLLGQENAVLSRETRDTPGAPAALMQLGHGRPTLANDPPG